jgi:DNA polymerase III delta prime subunit
MFASSSTISTLLDRNGIASQIKDILRNFDKNINNIEFKKGIYLYGSPGCGKTYFVTELLRELNYDIIHFDAGDVRNKTLIESITCDNMSSQNVLTMMRKEKKKIAIIMDEIDGMNNGDKGSITSLIKLIRQKKTKKQRLESRTVNPIICIGNYYVDKKIKELMKVCHLFELKKPTENQTTALLYHHIPTLSPVLVPQLMEYIQGDMRKVDFIVKMYRKNPDYINGEVVQKIFHLKMFTDDSKKITQQLLSQPAPLCEHAQLINETDRTIVALLWHENVVDHLFRPSLKFELSARVYSNILDNICFSDFIDRITFQNQIWQFNEMSSLIKTFYNNRIFHREIGCHIAPKEVRFTKVLTKYSTEYNNSLFVNSLCCELEMERKDCVAMFQEIRLHYGRDFYNSPFKLEEVEMMLNKENIDKLKIKRFYRYLDKNVKTVEVVLLEDEEDDDSI